MGKIYLWPFPIFKYRTTLVHVKPSWNSKWMKWWNRYVFSSFDYPAEKATGQHRDSNQWPSDSCQGCSLSSSQDPGKPLEVTTPLPWEPLGHLGQCFKRESVYTAQLTTQRYWCHPRAFTSSWKFKFNGNLPKPAFLPLDASRLWEVTMLHFLSHSLPFSLTLSVTLYHISLSLSVSPFSLSHNRLFLKWSRVERFLLQQKTDDERERDNFLRHRPLSRPVSLLARHLLRRHRRRQPRVERRPDGDARERRRDGWRRPPRLGFFFSEKQPNWNECNPSASNCPPFRSFFPRLEISKDLWFWTDTHKKFWLSKWFMALLKIFPEVEVCILVVGVCVARVRILAFVIIKSLKVRLGRK